MATVGQIADEMKSLVAPAASLALQSGFAEVEACGMLSNWTAPSTPGPKFGTPYISPNFTVDTSIPQKAAAVVKAAVRSSCEGSTTADETAIAITQVVVQGMAQGAAVVAIQASIAPDDARCSYASGWESVYASALGTAVGAALVETICCPEAVAGSLGMPVTEDIETEVAAAAGKGGWRWQLGMHAGMLSCINI